MQKILNATQIKALDAFTMQHEPIASIDLMERACRAFVGWFTERFAISAKVGIVCGTGNNGGDGLGIARLLKEWGYPVTVWIVRGSVRESDDFKINLTRIQGKVEIFEIITESDRGLFAGSDVLIDALFGSGLSRAPGGIYAQAIGYINQTDAIRVAVDIPSGLLMDGPSDTSIVKADFTISFHLPKLVFLLPACHPYVGQWFIVDIGLSKVLLKQLDTSHYYLQLKDARKILHPRSTFDHKGKYGHALLIAGSLGKMGAAVLASRAVLRSGAGLLTVHAPRCGYEILQTSVPEAMVVLDQHNEYVTQSPSLEKYSAIGVGPGLGQAEESVKAFARLLEQCRTPLVIDADALNILSAHRELMHNIPEGSILTPHPKEFERLVGPWSTDFDRLEKQKALAIQVKCVIILKGAHTSIASPDGKVYFNSTGNPGMATGGSGDVLTGILTGLRAQQYTATEASVLGTYLHGLAGDLAAHENGMDSLIASDIITFLPSAFKKICR